MHERLWIAKIDSLQYASEMVLFVQSYEDLDHYFKKVRQASSAANEWMMRQTGDQLHILRRMKFEPVGHHPIMGHKLNLVEQINQTWTFIAALAAVRQLLQLHPDVGGYHLAPGVHATQELDIMSHAENLVGAEVFAAVDPKNNRKLAADLLKLTLRPERHRYVFFLSPRYPGNQRWPALEKNGVQVWSVDA